LKTEKEINEMIKKIEAQQVFSETAKERKAARINALAWVLE
jgi:hypothetical protein